MLQDVPTILGDRYRIVERLGRGGMADVYQAEDTVLRRSVAIKVFRGGVERESNLARFRTEVRTLAALTHPHLVAVYDAGGDVTEPWCAMEFVNGGSLADRGGPMAAAEVARIGAQIASALVYVHSRGIVHRDVKPSNVLMNRDGSAFLSDFGIARLVDGTRMTQSGLMIGTAAFLSPEQVRGMPAGPPADVYGLGLVLLELLTGEREYPGTPVESAVSRLSRAPRVPESFGPHWVSLLVSMTREDAADRPDMADVTESLRSLALEEQAVAALSAGSRAGVVVLRPSLPGMRPDSSDPESTPSAVRSDPPTRVEDAVPVDAVPDPDADPEQDPAADHPDASDGVDAAAGPAEQAPAPDGAPDATTPDAPAAAIDTDADADQDPDQAAGPAGRPVDRPDRDRVTPVAPLPVMDAVERAGSHDEPPAGPRNLVGWIEPGRRRTTAVVLASIAAAVVVGLALPALGGSGASSSGTVVTTSVDASPAAAVGGAGSAVGAGVVVKPDDEVAGLKAPVQVPTTTEAQTLPLPKVGFDNPVTTTRHANPPVVRTTTTPIRKASSSPSVTKSSSPTRSTPVTSTASVTLVSSPATSGVTTTASGTTVSSDPPVTSTTSAPTTTAGSSSSAAAKTSPTTAKTK